MNQTAILLTSMTIGIVGWVIIGRIWFVPWLRDNSLRKGLNCSSYFSLHRAFLFDSWRYNLPIGSALRYSRRIRRSSFIHIGCNCCFGFIG